jgi:hypothetical protein
MLVTPPLVENGASGNMAGGFGNGATGPGYSRLPMTETGTEANIIKDLEALTALADFEGRELAPALPERVRENRIG